LLQLVEGAGAFRPVGAQGFHGHVNAHEAAVLEAIGDGARSQKGRRAYC
jgi:hypothetical protein